ncbi:hypothetical protein [Nostoc piscinale]|uniref:hypothetical protein n=1 Tax=Nostoc piscinale TaxID=224012 RepID=UPI001F1FFB1E|nr:hypothetical protein [Nostoc piscinale]
MNYIDMLRKKVQEVAPTMSPKIFTAEEGFRIYIAKAPTNDPKLQYRKEVEKYAKRGEISSTGHRILAALQEASGLTIEQAKEIEADVLKPYQEYKNKLKKYEQALVEALEHRYHLKQDTYNELKYYQKILGLRDEDIILIEKNLLLMLPGLNRFVKLSRKASLQCLSITCLLIGLGIVAANAISFYKKMAIKPITTLIKEKKYEECITKINQDFLLRSTEFQTAQQCYNGLIAQAKEIFQVNNDFEQAMRLLDLVPQGVLFQEVTEARESIVDLKHYRDAKEAESRCDWIEMKANLEKIKHRSQEMENSLAELIRKINTGEALIQMNQCPSRAIITN